VYKFRKKIADPGPFRIVYAVIFSFWFTSALIAQGTESTERFQYLSQSISKNKNSVSSCFTGLPFLCCSPLSLRVYYPEGGEVKLSVTSNRKWILTCSEKWISTDLEASGGFNEVIFNVLENPEAYERTARIVIKAEGLPVKIVMISQKARHDE
jgi:hypothetical protein